MSRATRAMSSALPQLLRLTSEIISGAILPSSSSRPTRRLACRPSVISGSMSAELDLGLHVGELLLHQLGGGERPAELLAVEGVLPGAAEAVFRGAERAPGD